MKINDIFKIRTGRLLVIILGSLFFNYIEAHAAKFTLGVSGNQCEVLFGNEPIIEKNSSKNSTPKSSSFGESRDFLKEYLRDAESSRTKIIGITFNRNSTDKAYAVHSKGDTFYFAAKNIDKLSKKLIEQTQTGDTFYWIPNGFENNAKASAFEATVRIQMEQANSSRRMRSIESIGDGEGPSQATHYTSIAELPQAYFVKGAVIKEVSRTKVQQGPYKGWFSVIVKFFVTVKGQVQAFTITILTRGENIVSEVMRIVEKASIRSKDSTLITAASIVIEIEREVKKVYPKLKDNEIGFLLQEEFAKNYLVYLNYILFTTA